MITDQVSSPSLTRVRFDPVQLHTVPEVDRLLQQLGLGSLDADDVIAYVGRNDNWAGTTSTGAKVFVKRVGGEPNDAQRRFRRITAFERVAARSGGEELRGPRFLGSDEDSRLVVFERLEESRSGSELAADEEFSDDLCRRAGRIIATLHGVRAEPGDLDESPHPHPDLDDVEALTLPVYVSSCFAELEAWMLIQSDRELADKLRALRHRERMAPRVPTHGDLRLDQYLLSGDELLLTDWEELRLGDAARDVGAFVGEWLYRVIQGIPKSIAKKGGREIGYEASHQDILTHGSLEIDRLRPRIEAFWGGYREVRQDVDDGFIERVAAFSGWHMLDRMLANARYVTRLSAGDRAAAGIGRTLLFAPDKFVSVLGLEGAS
ncbi:class V lanthionine synthetase subunit LxmK [Streptomyces alfalfae]